ncbi:MAG: hypothetical protein EXQ87_04050 [Alphaproteobacteria bacterium]|nr:hypothetical protein [Alphaproteobacteria bacterium]
MIRFEIDQAGVFRATGEPLLAQFFMDEIQGDPDRLALYEDKAAAVAGGKSANWRATGNAHRVELTLAGATIEALHGTPPQRARLSLAEFRQSLAACREFLAQES